MPPKRQIYLLDPKKLNPETIAVIFAKTSRSPQSFREIAAELSDKKSADFNEKWVVGYGHSSVAEHAVLHIAIENVSRMAVETLESNRLASYTEKSTRYQVWKKDQFVLPSELEGHALKKLYLQTCQKLFDSYEIALPKLEQAAQKKLPLLPGESETTWQRRTRSLATDVCRYYLPSAALANVGMTINARELEHCICKLLSHPLNEVHELGVELKKVTQEKLPTLVKYAEESSCLDEVQTDFSKKIGKFDHHPSDSEWCQILNLNPEGEILVLAALLYRFSHQNYEHCLDKIRALSKKQRKELSHSILGKLGMHDIPLRELEYATATIEIVLDQGAYGELKRHRMMTQTPQSLSTIEGFVIPRLISLASLEKDYQQTMENVINAFREIYTFDPFIASYVIPNAFNRRVLLHFNLRSAHHLVKLRTSPQAHFAMRRAACRIAEEIMKCFPLFAPYFTPISNETAQGIEQEYFTSV
jgi:thymidylate synthase ThyX